MNVEKFVPYIIKKNGYDRQLQKATEELAELAVEIMKYIPDRSAERRENIAEETADVYLMLKQIKQMIDIDDLEIEIRMQGKVNAYFEKEEERAKSKTEEV